MATWRDQQALKLGAKPLSFIPNRDGFEFVGVRHDGTEAACVLKKTERGAFVISGGAQPHEITGWRYKKS